MAARKCRQNSIVAQLHICREHKFAVVAPFTNSFISWFGRCGALARCRQKREVCGRGSSSGEKGGWKREGTHDGWMDRSQRNTAEDSSSTGHANHIPLVPTPSRPKNLIPCPVSLFPLPVPKFSLPGSSFLMHWPRCTFEQPRPLLRWAFPKLAGGQRHAGILPLAHS
jgi:hypothetical protein